MSDHQRMESLLATLARLASSAEALGAAVVHLSSDAEAPHPAIAGAVDRVAGLAGVPAGLSKDERALAAAFARTLFRQAAELIERPGRAPGWSYDDPTTLESQGRTSAIIARIIAGLPDEVGLRQAVTGAGARFLDVGTGVGWLAIGMAQRFPGLTVLGVDREPSVLSRAHVNVRAAGLEERIELRQLDAAELDARDRFDAAWLPGPFLEGAVFAAVAARTLAALRPGGWVVVGLYGDDDPLTAALAELRTLRSGGTVWRLEALATSLAAAGFVGAHELPKRWPAPIRLVVAQRPRGARDEVRP